MIRLSSLLALFLWALQSAANINFTVDYAIFQDNTDKPYVEFYLSIDGNSINYAQQENQLFQANLEVTYLIEKGEDVVKFKKVNLKSPEYTLEAEKLNLLDLKRIAIKEGDYSFTVIVKDLISGFSSEVTDDMRKVVQHKNEIAFSEIQLATQYFASKDNGMFAKNGFDIIPNVTHTYNKDRNELILYIEIYHADKKLANAEDYLIDIKVNDVATGFVASGLRSIKRMRANSIAPIIKSFDLDKLPNGEYDLLVEARNKKNEVIASKKTSFLRSNPNFSLSNLENISIAGTFVDSIRDTELLTEYIKSLNPISLDKEVLWADNQLRFAELEFMQRFFYSFWKERNSVDPEKAWLEYKEKVDFVDEKFGYGNVNGYNTERGRVYLQYGAPNTVQNVPYDRDTYPYEIWQYYKLQGLTDRKIIFYSPSMEMMGYEILHSNIRGERNNPNWEFELINKTNNFSPTIENPRDVTIQKEAKDLFNNPR